MASIRGQIILRQPVRHLEIVIEAFARGRTDAQTDPRIEVLTARAIR